ncbi:hypothetical protein ACIRFF_08730 [Streptomyces cyaneofuscatus]
MDQNQRRARAINMREGRPLRRTDEGEQPTTPNTAYLVMFTGTPTAIASDLATAQAAALTDRCRPAGADQYENRWDETPSEWQLMTRRRGTGGRWVWTLRSVRALPVLPSDPVPPLTGPTTEETPDA